MHMYAELEPFTCADFASLLMADVLKEHLADYVQGKYIVLAEVEVGSVKESPKKKRRKVLATRRRRTAPDGGTTQVAEMQREGERLDEIAWGER